MSPETEKVEDEAAVMLLVDRLAVAREGDEVSRLAESAETAFFEGRDCCTLVVWHDGKTERHDFSKRFEADGMTFCRAGRTDV